MVNIDNETLCILTVVFIVFLILFFLGSGRQYSSSPCGMKIASKYGERIGPEGPWIQPNLFQGDQSPMGVPSGFAMDAALSGINASDSNMIMTPEDQQVYYTSPKTQHIYPPDVLNPKYITEYGVSKGINEVSGKPFDSYLPPSPFSMRVAPSTTLTKN